MPNTQSSGPPARIRSPRPLIASVDETNAEVAMLAKHRDYAFDEWVTLTPEAKFEIMLHYWNPRRPEIGEKTRLAITAFATAHPLLADHALATTAYFSNWGWCIAVVVPETSVPVPHRFDVFHVVKGVGTGSGPDRKRP